MFLFSVSEDRILSGVLSLSCLQELQNGSAPLDRSDHVVFVGPACQPISVLPSKDSVQSADVNGSDEADCQFGLLFCHEGNYKVKANLELSQETVRDQLSGCDQDLLFLPILSFSVVTKVGS